MIARLIVSVFAVLACTAGSQASGGFHCTADTENIAIDIAAVVSHTVTSPASNFKGSVEFKTTVQEYDGEQLLTPSGEVKPISPGKISLSSLDLHQYWFHRGRLRLIAPVTHSGYEGFLEIDAKSTPNIEYRYFGTYSIELFDGTLAYQTDGWVECLTE